jgi:hypothetical protein
MTDLTVSEALDFFGVVFRGKHHIDAALNSEGGVHWINRYTGDMGLCTFDGNELTRLVLLAHERCIRVSVGPSGPRMIKITITGRDPSSETIMCGHPTIEQAIGSFRENRFGQLSHVLGRKR